MLSSAVAVFTVSLLAALPLAAGAQTASSAAPLQYATAVVRLAADHPPFIGCDTQPARLHCFLNLRGLVSRAYSDSYEFVLQGPHWSDDRVWELEATIDPADMDKVKALSRDQRSAMMQSILADRFGLKTHTEMREEPVYDLVIAKGGHKLQPAAPASDAAMKDMPKGFPSTGFIYLSEGVTHGYGVTMTEIMHQLPGSLGFRQIDRLIVDKTGLTGRWNFTMEVEYDNDKAPSPFTTLEEQLGLKLVPAKEPFTVLIIDAAHAPSEN